MKVFTDKRPINDVRQLWTKPDLADLFPEGRGWRLSWVSFTVLFHLFQKKKVGGD